MKVGVAISNYMQDDMVKKLVSCIVAEVWPIEGILVVDSQGSGELSNLDIDYFNADHNLGSAGNLRLRLLLAAQKDWDYVLTLNHDALFTRDALEILMRHANKSGIGALYPLKYYRNKLQYDLSGTRHVGLFPSAGCKKAPCEDLIEHLWSSSNGALYSLEPVRRGLSPDGNLWMGWEDYLYGLDLHKAGYRQFVVTQAVVEDSYEYEIVDIPFVKLRLSRKPIWYNYYRTRNLWLIVLYHFPRPLWIVEVALRTILELIKNILFSERRLLSKAIYLQVLGFYHATIRKEGQVVRP